jgi:hypothetical protein
MSVKILLRLWLVRLALLNRKTLTDVNIWRGNKHIGRDGHQQGCRRGRGSRRNHWVGVGAEPVVQRSSCKPPASPPCYSCRSLQPTEQQRVRAGLHSCTIFNALLDYILYIMYLFFYDRFYSNTSLRDDCF